MKCKNCNKESFALFNGWCKKCREMPIAIATAVAPVKPKKTGRPASLTPEQRAKNRRAWRKANPRTEYFKAHHRSTSGVVRGMFIIEHDGLYKRDKGQGWDANRSLAKVYKTMKYAQRAVEQSGKGRILHL